MDEAFVLDPCAILDQDIRGVEDQLVEVQNKIDTLLREWVSLSLLEIAFKQARIKRNPDERKRMTVRRVECKTQARTLGCKRHELGRQRDALLALKEKLSDPEIAKQINEMAETAFEISECPD